MTTAINTAVRLNMKAKTAEQQQAIVQELQRQQASAHDFIVNESNLACIIPNEVEDGHIVRRQPGTWLNVPVFAEDVAAVRTNMKLGVGAELQLFEKLGIPARYGQRLRDEAPLLLEGNLNYWFAYPQVVKEGTDNGPATYRRFQLRTLDNVIRAVLSPGYMALDSYDYLFRILQITQPKGGVVKEITLTDDRFTMFVVHEDWARDLEQHRGVMDHMVPGILFQNSETGEGRLGAQLKWWKQSCGNGMTTERIVARTHLGSQLPDGIISKETRAKAAELVWSEVTDMVNAAFDEQRFEQDWQAIQGLAQQVLEQPNEAIEKFGKDNGISDEEKQQILNNMLVGGDPTMWGLLNAVTLAAQQQSSVDRQHQLEEAAGKLVLVHR